MVYLRMQPYRMAAFGLRQAIKLTTKYYGPYRILEFFGHVAYKLQLPHNVGIQSSMSANSENTWELMPSHVQTCP